MRHAVFLLALVSALAPACKGADNTKIVVAVWSDLAVPDDLDSVRFDVAGTGTGSKTLPITARSQSGQTTLVAELELVPLGAKDETFTVTATGLHKQAEVVAQTASVSFVAGQSLLLKLFLAGNCKGLLTCPETYTCAAGACNQPIATPNLPPYDPSVTLSPPDAGTALDGASGAVDSGTPEAGNTGEAGGASGLDSASGTGGVAGSDARPIDASLADAVDAPLGGAGGAGGRSGTGGSSGAGGAGAGGSSGVVASGGVAASGGVVAHGGVVAFGGIVGTGGAAATGDWADWPMPNDQVDVTAGAPNLENYADNRDGTVTDNVTGLMWQQTVPTGTYTWAQAVAYCPTVTLAGHSDWRLPSRIELVSIVDLGVTSGPMISSTYFPSTPAATFWSSSPVAGSPSDAWGVLFYLGLTYIYVITDTYSVRCVR